MTLMFNLALLPRHKHSEHKQIFIVAEKFQVFCTRLGDWGPLAGSSLDLLRHCGGLSNVLCHRVLGGKQHRQGQEETDKAGSESSLCPGLQPTEEDRRMLARLASIRSNYSHPLHPKVEALGSSFSTRPRHPQSRKESSVQFSVLVITQSDSSVISASIRRNN